VKFSFVTLICCAIATNAVAQSASEHHVWQDARGFDPFSRTAQTVTGKIVLSGQMNRRGIAGGRFI
jgi:hypothetical protein